MIPVSLSAAAFHSLLASSSLVNRFPGNAVGPHLLVTGADPAYYMNVKTELRELIVVLVTWIQQRAAHPRPTERRYVFLYVDICICELEPFSSGVYNFRYY